MLYGDLIGSFIAFPVAAGFAVQLVELLLRQQREEEDGNHSGSIRGGSSLEEEEEDCGIDEDDTDEGVESDNSPPRNQRFLLVFAVATTVCFSLTAVARLLAFVYGDNNRNVSRIAFLLGMTSVVLMNMGQWPIQGVCNVTPQCQGTLVTNVLANISLTYREKISRIAIVFVVGSYVSIQSPHSNYLTDTLPTVGLSSFLLGLLLALWEHTQDIRSKVRMDLVTVHGARFVLAAIFLHQSIKLMISWCYDSESNYNSKRDIFDLMKAAVVACTGIAATGSFQSEISKKEHLESLVQKRTQEIQKQSQHLNMVNMALQASETAIAITDSSRCIIWSNAAFDEQLATTASESSSLTPPTPTTTTDTATTMGTTSTTTTTTRRRNSKNLSGLPLMDVLDFKTKEDRCYLAGAFDLSIKRQDEICIGSKIFKLEVSPFGSRTTTTATTTITSDDGDDEKKKDRNEDQDCSKEGAGTPKIDNPPPTTTTRFLVVFKDMTADRAREHAENQAREESMMAKAMGDSMVTLTHELRTPLQGIMGITSLLLSSSISSGNDNDDGGSNESRSNDASSSSSIVDSLKLIMASSSLLLNLINNLLDVKKATAKMLDAFPLASVSASNPIKDAIVFCKPLASISNVQLVTDTSLAPMAMYTERGSQIKITTKHSTMKDVRYQMKSALASSASLSFPDHNTSGVASMEDRHHNDDRDTSVLIFNVSDRGPGIKSDQAHRLFRQFAQLDNHQQSRTLGSNKIGQPSGTGLGLHLCQIFVERMNGHIWATNNGSAMGGSTFSFCLPLLSSHTNESSSASAEIRATQRGRASSQLKSHQTHHYQTATGGESMAGSVPSSQRAMSYCKQLKVLFVDDTLINRKVLSRILMKVGFAKIKTVDSGRNALAELSKEKNYDIVVTDLQMPGMSGTELSESIFKMDVVSSTSTAAADSPDIFKRPVVVGLTADTGLDVTERCQASGMSDVLHKPITVEEMKAYSENKLLYLRPGIWYEQEGLDHDVTDQETRGIADLLADTHAVHQSASTSPSSPSSDVKLIASRAQ